MSSKSLLKRRPFLFGAAATSATAAIATGVLANQRTDTRSAQYHWRMVSRWDQNFPDQFAAGQRLANRIGVLSQGRIAIKVLLPDQIMPRAQVLNAVSNGSVEMYRGLSYDWRNRSRTFDFFTVMPFGLTQNEMTAWLYYFGGQPLWDEMYGAIGIKPFAAGSLGAQSFGWFRNEIRSVADLQGMQFRTTGLGVDVLSKLGVKPVSMNIPQIVKGMSDGTLGGFELVGPLVDSEFELQKLARYNYFPSYNQPAGMIELIVSKKLYDSLPADLQQVIAITTQAEHDQGLAEANAGNARALAQLTSTNQVQIRQLPREVLISLGKASGEVLSEIRNSGDDLTRRTLNSYLEARRMLTAWSQVSDQSFLTARTLPFTYG